ncbi:MAG: hypothetical protein M3Z64_05900 [Verrucomicrobiota bacterium]|nr:hypothetical protein [Verrucomicrobiota bacterium]
MKKLILSLLTLLVALAPSLFGQTSPTPFPTWAQSYGAGNYTPTGGDPDPVYPSSGYDLATDIAAMPDGGVVVSGVLYLPEFSFNQTYAQNGISTLVRYGADGRVIWQQTLRQNNDAKPPYYAGEPVVATNYIYQVLTDAAGNIFVGLNQQETPGGGARLPVVAKFSANGALIWQNGIRSEYDYGSGFGSVDVDGVGAPFPFTLTPDGGVLFGGKERPSEAHDIPVYAKFNPDGSLGVHRPFTSSGQFSGFSFSCQSADGSRILSAVDDSSGGAVVLTNAASGAFLGARTFYTDNNGRIDPIVRALPMADGGFILLGQGFTLHRVRADLTPIWEKVLSTPSPGMNLAVTSDGGFLLTGLWEIDHVQTGIDVLLLKLDANGNPMFARAIGGPKNDGYNGAQGGGVPLPTAVQTADGGYAFTCSSFSYKTGPIDAPDFWTVKTDGNGHVNNFPGFQIDIPVSVFKAHDNTTPSQVASFDASYPKGFTGGAETRSYGIIQEDLSNNIGVNKPTIMVQTATAIPPPVHVAYRGWRLPSTIAPILRSYPVRPSYASGRCRVADPRV